MTVTTTRMFDEAGETAAVLRLGQQKLQNASAAAAVRLLAHRPLFIATSARGSSDHAATYAKYLIETRARIPTLSQAPSLASIFDATSPSLGRAALLTISQSGRSEDLLRTALGAKSAGALIIALVNDSTSPLAALADCLIPLGAGPEISVAATKSFIAALAALLSLVAEWQDAPDLRAASNSLPTILQSAWSKDWSVAEAPLAKSESLLVLGRGLTLGVAQEMALKFKETCGLHAEAFSTAEVAHGPAALIGPGFPVLLVPPHDTAAAGIREQIAEFRSRGALTIVVGDGFGGDIVLPVDADLPTEMFPIAAIQSFYKLVNSVALARGRNPDQPPYLRKVTDTR
jgi:glucosamine--fructose-6-phosphate aminotransferase (isomerizing)